MSSPASASDRLWPEHLAHLQKFRILDEVLWEAGVRSIADLEARDVLGKSGHYDHSGIFFPTFDREGRRWGGRIRLDHKNGDQRYDCEQWDRHLYFGPHHWEFLTDATVHAVVMEAEKSALALTSWARRNNGKILSIATGGCSAWRRKTGTEQAPDGRWGKYSGPSPDLDMVAWMNRKVVLLADSNFNTNDQVAFWWVALGRELEGRGAIVKIVVTPKLDGVNGPDDFLAVRGDLAMQELLNSPSAPASKGMIMTKKGNIRALVANAITAIDKAPEWQGVLGFNEFSLLTVARKSPPWEKTAGTPWADVDDIRTAEWLQHKGVLVGSQVAHEAVQAIAAENPFHPVREYLNSLTWDGADRLTGWLSNYLGAASTEYSCAIGARWLISAVARIFKPGCQADYTLVVEGPQGALKSSAFRSLAGPDWFTDRLSDLGTKDAREELHGIWIVELAELASIRRSVTETVKNFLTARIDHYRQSYGRRAIHAPRQNVFAGSVNDATPFVDETGNRRFWPIKCGFIDLKKLAADRDQIWAEACHRYRQGEIWWLDTPNLNQLAAEEQEDRYQAGVWDQIIEEWIADPTQRHAWDPNGRVHMPVTPFTSNRDRVTVLEVLLHAIGKDPDKIGQKDRNEVVRWLTHNKWEQKRQKSVRFYVRPS